MSIREATSKEGTDMNKRTNLLAVITSDPSVSMPEGFDTWGVKSVYPDLITTHDFQWALPGESDRSLATVMDEVWAW